jgi:hypothetical protein
MSFREEENYFEILLDRSKDFGINEKLFISCDSQRMY